MLARLFVFAGMIVQFASASPAPRSTWTDPPFSVPTANLSASVTCPNGLPGQAAGGIVFLIHGTGSSGAESWAKGPYHLILPTTAPGYDICWVDLPYHSLGNAAISAEYVAYNIIRLANQSATGKVFVIGHSQGAGCNIPWALDFFPSTQQYVSGFVALSGDFHGVQLAPTLRKRATEGEALFQQSAGSQYLRAQNIDGNQALVGTTSLFTAEDEVIPPEPEDSTLPGASNILIQSPDACGPLHVVDHFLAPFDSGYFGLVLDALTHGGVASTSRLDKAYCAGFKGNTLVNPTSAAAALSSTVHDVIRLLTPASPAASAAEPPLPEYVCQRYPTGNFTCAPGPLT